MRSMSPWDLTRVTAAPASGLLMFWGLRILPSLLSLSSISGCKVPSVQPIATPWTKARQAPPSMGFSRQESWRGLPFLFIFLALLSKYESEVDA